MNNITITREQFEIARAIDETIYDFMNEFPQFEMFDLYELCDCNLDYLEELNAMSDKIYNIDTLEDLEKYVTCMRLGEGCVDLLIHYEHCLGCVNDKDEDPNDPDETPFWQKALNKMDELKEELADFGYDISTLEEPTI